MPRDSSPPEVPSLERTAHWVQAQVLLAQSYAAAEPPSPARSSTKTVSTYRTTTSSEDASLKPSLARSSTMQGSTHQHIPSTSTTVVPPATQRPRYDARARRASLPFPQSPPGSGYPMTLEVAHPRRPESEDRKASRLTKRAPSLDAKRTPQSQTPRPSLRKQRRPSLIDQIMSIGSSGSRRKEETGKKA